MPTEEVLVLAMTRMHTGICTAGLTTQPDPATVLRWVRPVKEHDSLLLGDMTDSAGRVVQCSDVITLNLHKARPEPPHVEDWLTDFIYARPRVVRRLEGERRVSFLATHLDRAPQDILVHQTRSLCLIHPDDVWARFAQDPQTGKYETRLGFQLAGVRHARANSPSGIPVTDIKWRALGRGWLSGSAGPLALTRSALLDRLAATDIYLALGLSRGYEGQYWLMVIGVHVVPDYEAAINYSSL